MLFPAAKTRDKWRDVLWIAACDQDLPNLSKCARIVLTFRAQNATVERGFSLANRLKTDLRNRILPEVLNELIRIRLYPDALDFDAVYDHWLDSSPRYGLGLATGIKRPRVGRGVIADREDVVADAGEGDDVLGVPDQADADDYGFEGFNDDDVDNAQRVLDNYAQLFG